MNADTPTGGGAQTERVVIEAVLYVLSGALGMALLALSVAPALWRRAARLARERVIVEQPLGLTEVAAERDRLRAGFALEARRLENRVESFRARVADSLIEVDRLQNRIVALSQDVAARDQRISTLEGIEAGLRLDLATTQASLEGTREDLAAARLDLAAKADSIKDLQERVAILTGELGDRAGEIAVKSTHIGALQAELASLEAQLATQTAQRARLEDDLKQREGFLAREREKTTKLEARIDELNADVASKEERLDQRGRDLDRLRDVNKRLTASSDNVEKAIAGLERSQADLTRRLATVEAERDRLALEARRLTEEAAVAKQLMAEQTVLRDTLNRLADQFIGVTPSNALPEPSADSLDMAQAETTAPAGRRRGKSARAQITEPLAPVDEDAATNG